MYFATEFCTLCYLAIESPPLNSARLSGGIGPYGTIQRYNGYQWEGFCDSDNADQNMEYYYTEMGYIDSSVLDVGPR